jgi:flagellar hook assembly protein FlgD
MGLSTSPILSNSITDICVEGKSGEIFFGTEKGLVSFKGTATEGAANYDDVMVFPNPVRETYHGPIAIKGLVAETTVKITDISGNLVNELNSFGGQAVWDGTDFNGNRVATGTYLIFLANRADRDATRAHVTKILFIH